MYNIFLTHQAVKDAQKLEQAGLKPKAAGIPFQGIIKIVRMWTHYE